MIVNKYNVLIDHITVIGNILQNIMAVINCKSLSTYMKIEEEDCGTACATKTDKKGGGQQVRISKMLKKKSNKMHFSF